MISFITPLRGYALTHPRLSCGGASGSSAWQRSPGAVRCRDTLQRTSRTHGEWHALAGFSRMYAPSDPCHPELPEARCRVAVYEVESVLGSPRSCERDLNRAMIAGRIIESDRNKNSKLAHTREWQVTTLPEELGLGDVRYPRVTTVDFALRDKSLQSQEDRAGRGRVWRES